MEPKENSGLEIHLPKKRVFPKIFWGLLLVFFLLLGATIVKALSISNKLFVNRTSFFKKVGSLFSDSALKGEVEGKIRILLLGYGGEGHDGSYLTDSIVLLTINTDERQLLLQSVPRDLYWEAGRQKINFAYAAGLAKTKDHEKAGASAMAAIENITGLSVPYFASIDFKGFEAAVDALGGLDVNIPDTFTDSTYPDEKLGYLPPITFNKGTEHMNGVRALEYARSRHAVGDQGSDFARSRRQSIIIESFKNKVQNLNLLADSGKINKILNIVADDGHTNLDPNNILRLAKIVKGQDYKILSENLDLNSPLICPEILDQIGYVLKACPGISKNAFKEYFSNAATFAKIRSENANIIIEDTGTDTDYYKQIKAELTALGLTVYEVPYKGLPLRKSVLYKINEKPELTKYLEKKLNIQSSPKPDKLKASSDLVLFVGNNNQ